MVKFQCGNCGARIAAAMGGVIRQCEYCGGPVEAPTPIPKHAVPVPKAGSSSIFVRNKDEARQYARGLAGGISTQPERLHLHLNSVRFYDKICTLVKPNFTIKLYEIPILMWDDSALRTGKNGFLITTQIIYYHNSYHAMQAYTSDCHDNCNSMQPTNLEAKIDVEAKIDRIAEVELSEITDIIFAENYFVANTPEKSHRVYFYTCEDSFRPDLIGMIKKIHTDFA